MYLCTVCINQQWFLITCKFYFCSFHLSVGIDVAVAAVLGVFTTALKLLPKFRANGGSLRENLALQNVQVVIINYTWWYFIQFLCLYSVKYMYMQIALNKFNNHTTQAHVYLDTKHKNFFQKASHYMYIMYVIPIITGQTSDGFGVPVCTAVPVGEGQIWGSAGPGVSQCGWRVGTNFD